MTPQNCPTDSRIKIDTAKAILPTVPLMLPKNNFTAGNQLASQVDERISVHADILTCPISTSSAAIN